MRMIHALSVQLRQVLSWKLLSCILVFAGVQGLAISGLMAATPNPTALYYYVLSTTSGTTYLTFYVLPAIPFSMSLAQEWATHATPYWVIRSGSGVYTFSKLMGGAMGGFFTVGGGSLLFLLVAGVIAGNFGPTQGIDTIYQSLLEQGQIVWGLVLFILHNALSGATIGMLGTFFTILFHNQLWEWQRLCLSTCCSPGYSLDFPLQKTPSIGHLPGFPPYIQGALFIRCLEKKRWPLLFCAA